MIERLSGICVHRGMAGVVIDVHGVGYGVELSEPFLMRCVVGEPLTLWIHTHSTDKGLSLYGFRVYEEKVLFQAMLGVSGVGPKAAMALLAKLGVEGLVKAVLEDDEDSVKGARGIGAKAKKIVLDLKPKLKKLNEQGLLTAWRKGATAWIDQLSAVASGERLNPMVLLDLRSALENLGYKDKEIQPVLRKLETNPPANDFGTLVRAALAELVSGNLTRETSHEPIKDEELF